MWGCAEKFALRFQKDLEAIEVKTVRSPAAAAGSVSKGQQGGGKKGRVPDKEARAIRSQKSISLGLRTAVLAFATNWLLRHCRGILDSAAAGEFTTML